MPRQLTLKLKKFCETYVANGYKAIPACKEAYPNIKTEGSLRAMPYQLLAKLNIRDYIGELEKDIYERNRINAEHIGNEIATMAFGELDAEKGITPNVKLKALELLGKQINLYTQRVELEGETTINVNIVEDDND